MDNPHIPTEISGSFLRVIREEKLTPVELEHK